MCFDFQLELKGYWRLVVLVIIGIMYLAIYPLTSITDSLLLRAWPTRRYQFMTTHCTQ